ncbi:MAG: 2-C-methyl-D-erythritol 4-phosphate cytidylyltransferase [Lentisphaerae bacterium]|nr:2-C-methyl-D-erythritol 4-phosphate cytidylyltransferase [Lentisphaerota bacterium]MCP4100838.1 2-C-methyl-D-erythritol 4-phosphate cytidylyltransferase [Lentisphaerota bacterium]
MKKNLGIIIAAAGFSRRYGAGNKLLLEFRGVPLFLYSAKEFRRVCPEENIVIVCSEDAVHEFKDIAMKLLPENRFNFVVGGEQRSDSVKNGLKALPESVEFAAVHDAARPLATCELLLKCLEAARSHGGAIPAKPVTDTLKRTDDTGKIIETVCRGDLWRVETPQVFDVEKLCTAYNKAEGANIEFTDDAAVMEYAGYPVYVVNDLANNMKVTFSADIRALDSIEKDL